MHLVDSADSTFTKPELERRAAYRGAKWDVAEQKFRGGLQRAPEDGPSKTFLEGVAHLTGLALSNAESYKRLATIAARYGMQVIFLDLKGSRKTAAQFVASMHAVGCGRIAVYPRLAYDGWRGDADALRTAADRERAAVDHLTATARGLLTSQGQELSAAAIERVRETLHAAALDQDARQQVSDGCLEHELRHVGMGPGGPAGDVGAVHGHVAALLDVADRHPGPEQGVLERERAADQERDQVFIPQLAHIRHARAERAVAPDRINILNQIGLDIRGSIFCPELIPRRMINDVGLSSIGLWSNRAIAGPNFKDLLRPVYRPE